MRFTHYDLGPLAAGDVVQVHLNGNAANVKLMDGPNFTNYRQGRGHRYVGGLAERRLTRLAVAHSGHWHLTVDLNGLAGTTRSSVDVVRN